MKELALCLQPVNEYAYNMFSFIKVHKFDLFLDFWPQFLHIQMSKRDVLWFAFYK